jgi:predicted peptidase
MNTALLSLLLAAAVPSAANADAANRAGLLSRTLKLGASSYAYQVYVPAAVQNMQRPPVVLFLHGIGQRGEGGFVPTAGSAAALINSYLEKIPAIVVLPQCRSDRLWPEPEMERMAMAALDQTVSEFGGDANRLYLAGVSMGGYGAWAFAAHRPEKFAAAVVICGGSPLLAGDRYTPIARHLAHTPVWVFHGADDRVVPVTESRRMVAALKKAQGSVRYSEFAGVGHNVWLNALAEPGLLPWLLEQRLGRP